MGGGKETPRQKLIGLMYLVLMALLAMNVSKEVINAFVTLNDKIEAGNTIIKGTMDGAYGSFEQAIAGIQATGGSKEDIENIKKIQAQAMQVKEWSKGLTNYFVEQSSELIKFAQDEAFGTQHEGEPTGTQHYSVSADGYYELFPLMHLGKKDDYDAATNLYVGEGGFANPKGTYIVDSITDYRNRLCTLIANYTDDKGVEWSFTPPDVKYETEGDPASLKAFQDGVNASLSTVNPADTALIKQLYSILTPPEKTDNHGEVYPWIAKQFDHAPLVAAIAMFTAIRSDILQAENKAVTHIASRVSAPKFNFNKIEPLAFAPASYINQGDSIKLSVMIAAYDSTEAMKINYWLDDSTMTGDGSPFEAPAGTKLKLPGGGVGQHTLYGNIAVKEKGVEKWKGWRFDYSVGAPNATVSAYDLMVLYAGGHKNRIKVSAGGFDPATVTASCSGCDIKKEGDFWIATATKVGGKATISVTAKTPEGKSVSLASEEFRIFPLPTPKPQYGGKGFGDNSISAAIAKKGLPVVADMAGAPIDIPYKITGFELLISNNGKVSTLKSKSANFTPEMKNALNGMGKGSTLNITQIKAAGPSGKEMPIGNLTFVLN
jgi:gliding motility-associated protein GldM